MRDPDVLFGVHENAGDRAHDPVIGHFLRPVRIDLEGRRVGGGFGLSAAGRLAVSTIAASSALKGVSYGGCSCAEKYHASPRPSCLQASTDYSDRRAVVGVDAGRASRAGRQPRAGRSPPWRGRNRKRRRIERGDFKQQAASGAGQDERADQSIAEAAAIVADT
jgi:hypothetical protein